jgi:intracellular multiplication protein IcmT
MVSEQIDNIQEKMNWHWRNTMRTVRFLTFDARAALAIPILLVYARTSTIIITILVLLLFRYLERKGLTFPSSLRALRAWSVGHERPGWLGVNKKRFTDYG